ncbi:MAG: helix-turn-helix domain-containing protein [Clostridium sp.]
MNLREYRNNQGFQRKFVVDKTGISSKHLNDVEAGKVNLTDNIATRLSKFYKLDKIKIVEMWVESKNGQKQNIT